jgi:flavin-dependent dehydrogenase
LIKGGGPTGLTCAKLLLDRGWDVSLQIERTDYHALVVLTDAALELLQSVWKNQLQSSIVHRLLERAVYWGYGEPAIVAHPSYAVDLWALREHLTTLALQAGVHQVEERDTAETEFDWTIFAGGRNGNAPGEARRFGSRHALSGQIELVAISHRQRCVMEAVPGGWLFLIPQQSGLGTIQAMVGAKVDDPCAALQRLLGRARHIPDLVGALSAEVRCLAAMPKQLVPPFGENWIAVGDAAMALDPVSGDGIGHGIRTALLAVAVLDALAQGKPPTHYLEHYARRIQLAVVTHLAHCIASYESARLDLGLGADLAAMKAALPDLQIDPARFEYSLSPAGLVPRAIASLDSGSQQRV